MNDPCIAGFGEIMLRLSPPGALRFPQSLPGTLEATFGGGEANVCASLAILGGKSRYLTVLPRNPVADALVAQLRGIGVDTTRILRTDKGRLGIYFTEVGANQRGSSVVYDRAMSSIAQAEPADYDYAAMLDGVTWLHITGITPALSEVAYLSTLAIAAAAAERGITISCDLNFRKKLWNWRKGTAPKALAAACMGKIVPLVDVIVGNEEDAQDVFGIAARGTSVEAGRLDVEAYADVAKSLSEMFPKARHIAITLRESISADHNNWGAMLYDVAETAAHFAPLDADGRYRPYEIRDIVDRIGGGDSFSAGLIHGLSGCRPDTTPKQALAFAVAASCLKHSVRGDYNFTSLAEVESLLQGSASGRVKR
ncbi:MAG: sugar kinase [Kiritimatiellia bacterium]